MRKSKSPLIMSGLLTLSLAALVGQASAEPGPKAMTEEAEAPDIPNSTSGGELTPDQMVSYDSWPAEQRTSYDGWPIETQAYFWTLPPHRQELFWRLNDEDRVTLSAMSGPNQEEAWLVLESRVTRSESPEGSSVPDDDGGR